MNQGFTRKDGDPFGQTEKDMFAIPTKPDRAGLNFAFRADAGNMCERV
jgi:hypothetical protein